jgi:hypothetical protein
LAYPRVAMGAAALVLGLGVRAWARGLAAATRVIALFRAEAHQLHLIDCPEETRPPSASAVPRDESVSDAGPGDHGWSPPNSEGADVRAAFVPAFRSVVVQSPSPSENSERFA